MDARQLLQALRAHLVRCPLGAEHVHQEGDALHLAERPWGVGVSGESELHRHLALGIYAARTDADENSRINGEFLEVRCITFVEVMLGYHVREASEVADTDAALTLLHQLVGMTMDMRGWYAEGAQAARIVTMHELVELPDATPYILLRGVVEVHHFTRIPVP